VSDLRDRVVLDFHRPVFIARSRRAVSVGVVVRDDPDHAPEIIVVLKSQLASRGCRRLEKSLSVVAHLADEHERARTRRLVGKVRVALVPFRVRVIIREISISVRPVVGDRLRTIEFVVPSGDVVAHGARGRECTEVGPRRLSLPAGREKHVPDGVEIALRLAQDRIASDIVRVRIRGLIRVVGDEGHRPTACPVVLRLLEEPARGRRLDQVAARVVPTLLGERVVDRAVRRVYFVDDRLIDAAPGVVLRLRLRAEVRGAFGALVAVADCHAVEVVVVELLEEVQAAVGARAAISPVVAVGHIAARARADEALLEREIAVSDRGGRGLLAVVEILLRLRHVVRAGALPWRIGRSVVVRADLAAAQAPLDRVVAPRDRPFGVLCPGEPTRVVVAVEGPIPGRVVVVVGIVPLVRLDTLAVRVDRFFALVECPGEGAVERRGCRVPVIAQDVVVVARISECAGDDPAIVVEDLDPRRSNGDRSIDIGIAEDGRLAREVRVVGHRRPALGIDHLDELPVREVVEARLEAEARRAREARRGRESVGVHVDDSRDEKPKIGVRAVRVVGAVGDRAPLIALPLELSEQVVVVAVRVGRTAAVLVCYDLWVFYCQLFDEERRFFDN